MTTASASSRARSFSVVAALVAFALLGLGGLTDPRRALVSYLIAYSFGVTIVLGALVFVMIGRVAHATWMVAIRRPLEAIVAALPLFAVLFVPIALFARRLYPWAGSTGPLDAETATIVAARGAWMALPAFILRAAVYFAVWVGLAEGLRRASLSNDRRRARVFAGAGLPVMAITITLAAYDWLMSVEPAWTSNIYGLYVFAGGFVAAVSLVALLVRVLSLRLALPSTVGVSHFHALGNVMLTGVAVWGYFAFAQLLILWTGDVPDEIVWYLRRTQNGWSILTVLVFVTCFAAPFLCLLMHDWKRRPALLAAFASLVLIGHYLDIYWLVLPGLRPEGAPPSWLDPVALIAVVAAALAFALGRAKGIPLLPNQDPDLAASLRFEMR